MKHKFYKLLLAFVIAMSFAIAGFPHGHGGGGRHNDALIGLAV